MLVGGGDVECEIVGGFVGECGGEVGFVIYYGVEFLVGGGE